MCVCVVGGGGGIVFCFCFLNGTVQNNVQIFDDLLLFFLVFFSITITLRVQFTRCISYATNGQLNGNGGIENVKKEERKRNWPTLTD